MKVFSDVLFFSGFEFKYHAEERVASFPDNSCESQYSSNRQQRNLAYSKTMA